LRGGGRRPGHPGRHGPLPGQPGSKQHAHRPRWGRSDVDPGGASVNEMTALRALRAEVPEPSAEALRVTEARVLAELRVANPAPPRPLAWRIGWRAGLAAGLAAVVAVGVVSTRGGPAPRPAPPKADASSPARAVTVAQVLDLAAQAAETAGEITPRPNQ